MTSQIHTLPSVAEMQAQMQALIAQNAALQAKLAARTPRPSFKVTEKGAVSMYGLGRFPVTLYASQWETVLAHTDALKAFMAEHADELSRKD